MTDQRRLFVRSSSASVLYALLLLMAAGCTRSDTEAAPTASPTAPAPAPRAREEKLVVFAAASLREPFTTLAEDFKATHPQLELTFNFAGTQELRTQLEQGASADVFASADQRHMGELVKAKRVTGPLDFARNEPVVVVAKEQAATLRAFADLPRAKRIVVGTPEVPIGRYTLQILERAAQSLGAEFRASVEAQVVSRELNVKQVLAKVTLGEADAGLVYRSDARTAKDQVVVLTIPAELNVIAEYPIALVSDAAHAALAKEWIELVRSEIGQRALEGAGFLRVSPAP